MNRFRTKKKAKEAKEDALASRPNHDAEQSSMPSFKGFRRTKKSAEEPKKEFDLTSALPTNDDFRTSLLMTNLSARFSMLREQDDPNSKIGKASDDSVLLPKRQSRLADFGFGGGLGGLSDIAEVESIKAPQFFRMNSYVSDDSDSTKGGNIMNRAKPTEGNNLFGGRQKIYKITANGSTPKANGGMVGRALYEDDVAQSAFQLWRQAERQGRPADVDDQDDEAEPRRSESPAPLGYNRRRETSSTTSSASAIARNSTAATSVTSQPPALSIKDWQSTSTPQSSAATTPVLERNVTRTRRLYEQGLTQDLHDQQSSALSRIDTLARQRNIGSLTPDLVRNSPSPTTFAFGDRFGNDRRPVLAKASAPNLRSISPPTTGSSLGAAAGPPEPKTNFPTSPPLSPPISEAGEYPLLPIQPNDRGKATALGVFQKPVQPYDESKYAQRQLLRQGRETPTQRLRGESNASFATGRSRSSSSVQRQPLATIAGSAPKIELKPQDNFSSLTFLDESDDAQAPAELPRIETPQGLNRPSDKDHPAFREASLSTPLTMGGNTSDEPSPVSERPSASNVNSHQPSPVDSPTLGPTVGAGLSGMVRQHLRADSNASSVYDNAPPTADFDSRFPSDDTRGGGLMEGLEGKSNPWMMSGQDWHLSDPAARNSLEGEGTRGERDISFDLSTRDSSSNEMENEPDEFASQLANARRRVRERLTSYVESDSSRAPSPLLQPETPPIPLGQIPQLNPLGIGTLKPKTSRGSLIDRSRSIVGSQSKAMKMLGISSSTMSASSPSPSKQAFEDKDASTLATMEEEPVKEMAKESSEDDRKDEASTERTSADDEDNSSNTTHPGLRAFRQARRELQRRKELDTLAKHQAAQTSQPSSQREDHPSDGQSTPRKDRGVAQQPPSREHKPPPRPQRAPSEESGRDFRGNSNPASRQASTERNRSSSEASGSSAPGNGNRPARLRNNSNAYDENGQLRPNGGPRAPMMRSPGLPGTDIRRSPIMPPQGYPGSNPTSPMPSPGYFDRAASSGNLAPGQNRGGYDAHSSPNSPRDNGMGPPPSAYNKANGSGRTTPTAGGRPRRPSAPQSPAFSTTTSTLNDSMRRVVKKDDISEPTFIMSTSRVPTVNLPYSNSSPDNGNDSRSRSGSRSRSNSNAQQSAPPLPPINPRRKWEGSRARGMFGPFMGRKDALDDSQASLSSPHLPLAGPMSPDDSRSAFSVSDDEDGTKSEQRRRLRKATGESQIPTLRAGPGGGRETGAGPPQMVLAGPPASRMVVTQGMKPMSNNGMPGGMI